LFLLSFHSPVRLLVVITLPPVGIVSQAFVV